MDHVMSHIWDYSDYARCDLAEQWKSGTYKKLSDCPSYEEVKTYCKAYNALADHYYGPSKRLHRETPKSIVAYLLED